MAAQSKDMSLSNGGIGRSSEQGVSLPEIILRRGRGRLASRSLRPHAAGLV